MEKPVRDSARTTGVRFTLSLSLALASLLVPTALLAQAPVVAPQPPRPWPPTAEIARIRQIAESRPLFSADTPLTFTLAADFRAVQRDRDPESTITFPGTLTVERNDGRTAQIAVRLRTRGHSRRKPTNCTFAPLRIEFPPDTAGTPFEGQRNLKLGTHCSDQSDVPQYVVREYPIYRMYNMLSPRSFRARLAEVTYVDSRNGKPMGMRIGLMLEDDDDVARRMGGRVSDTQGLMFNRVDAPTTKLLSIFQYMIGNTDMSIFSLHNIIVVETPNGQRLPVPYDFDYSGLVNARYASPAAVLQLSSVRERLYRGPCLTVQQLEAELKPFRDNKDRLLGLYDAIPSLKPGDVQNAKRYLQQFFATIERPESAKKALVDGCNGRPRM